MKEHVPVQVMIMVCRMYDEKMILQPEFFIICTVKVKKYNVPNCGKLGCLNLGILLLQGIYQFGFCSVFIADMHILLQPRNILNLDFEFQYQFRFPAVQIVDVSTSPHAYRNL